MYLQRKLRFGGAFMILGGIMAAIGEVINAQHMDVLSPSWRLSLGFIIAGTFILLIGLSTFASASDEISGFGFLGSTLLLLGGFLLIVGTAAIDWFLLPFLIRLANSLASVVNTPAIQTQNALNVIIANLNNLGGSTVNRLFPGTIPSLPKAQIPMVDGTALVNSALVQLHLPTIATLTWWGRISLTGGTLTIGSLILGLALLRNYGSSSLTSILLIVFSLLNLACQFLASTPLWLGNGSGAAIFLTLAWLGASARFSNYKATRILRE